MYKQKKSIFIILLLLIGGALFFYNKNSGKKIVAKKTKINTPRLPASTVKKDNVTPNVIAEPEAPAEPVIQPQNIATENLNNEIPPATEEPVLENEVIPVAEESVMNNEDFATNEVQPEPQYLSLIHI